MSDRSRRESHHRSTGDRRSTRRERSRSRSPQDHRRHRDRSRSKSPADHRRHRDRSRSRERSRERQRDSRSYYDRERADRHYRVEDRHYNQREEVARSQEPAQQEVKKGLNIEVHPLLSQNIDPSMIKTGSVSFIPKASTSTVMANQRAAADAAMAKPTPAARKKERKAGLADPVTAFLNIKPADPAKNNLYFDPRISTSIGRTTIRPIRFQPKGKFVSQAKQMRREAEMEILRRDIAETSLNAGLDLDIVSDLLAMGADQVPSVEWWDITFCPETYDLSQINYSTVNNLIQRPALIEPPADLNVLVAPKPLALTKEEQKKMRRQRRLEEQKDKQEKIRLGLLPPEEPKIKLASLKNVLANESVQDPTKVEAQVKAKAAARLQAHLQANEERKLQAEEAAREKRRPQPGPVVNVAVFKINRVDHNQWRYKIKMNAIQDGLTGCAVYSPKTNIIVVEGPAKGLKHYKGLLLRRIKWNEPPEEKDAPDLAEKMQITGSIHEQPNECTLLWEGTVGHSSWRRFDVIEGKADIDVKDYFLNLGLEQYWNLARQ